MPGQAAGVGPPSYLGPPRNPPIPTGSLLRNGNNIGPHPTPFPIPTSYLSRSLGGSQYVGSRLGRVPRGLALEAVPRPYLDSPGQRLIKVAQQAGVPDSQGNARADVRADTE